jgi:hypothetical protein
MRLTRVIIHIVTEAIAPKGYYTLLTQQLINVKLPTLNPVNLTITDKLLLRHNNGRDSLADSSILDRPNGSLSLPRKVMQHENGVSSANRLSQLQPKNLVPCPFLRKRGYCLKGSRCDLLCNEVQPPRSRSQFQQIPIGAYSPPYVAPPYVHNQTPLSYQPNFFTPIKFPMFYPPLRPLPYPPPLMSIQTIRPPVY